ncbi:MAG TPA: FG-GAP-like repeat-containing protein, partial [Micromonosporaceae bacterium]
CTAFASTVVVSATPAAAATTCHGAAPSDFNGDGISDAVIGEPDIDDSGNSNGGRVHVVFGTRAGLTADASGSALNDQILAPSTPGIGGYGASIVTADFNGDGCADLAVGDPLAKVETTNVTGGVVHVYDGDPVQGFKDPITLDVTFLDETPGPDDLFGYALAAGDLNGDGLPDLIIGAPGENNSAGAIYVIPGDPDGPQFNPVRFAQGDGIVPGASEGGDQFGFALATGDFDGDHRADVAVGDPGENSRAGAVDVLRGNNSPTMLTASGAKSWSQNTSGISGTAEVGDNFGYAVAAGDFNGDHRSDLAVGVPGEGVGSATQAGNINVIYGSATGLTSSKNQGWNQNSAGVSGTAESQDEFGFALAAGDFNGNGRTDLAIGVPGEALGSVKRAGQVNVLIGASGGLTASGSSVWTQNTSGISGTAETNDEFGAGLAVIRVKSAGRDDLLVGVPGEALGSTTTAGMAHFIPGSGSGLTASGSQAFDDDSAGIQGTSCLDCAWGYAVG